jgi:hypothetical protein
MVSILGYDDNIIYVALRVDNELDVFQVLREHRFPGICKCRLG